MDGSIAGPRRGVLIERPASLRGTPNLPIIPGMDALSDALRVLRLTGAVFLAELTEAVLDAYYRNLYTAGFLYSVDRAFVSSCKTPCLMLAGNDEAHPYPIAEETAKLLPNAEFIPEWKAGAALEAAKKRVREFLAKHTPAGV